MDEQPHNIFYSIVSLILLTFFLWPMIWYKLPVVKNYTDRYDFFYAFSKRWKLILIWFYTILFMVYIFIAYEDKPNSILANAALAILSKSFVDTDRLGLEKYYYISMNLYTLLILFNYYILISKYTEYKKYSNRDKIFTNNIQSASDYYEEVLKKHILSKKELIRKIYQFYVGNHTLTDQKDFIEWTYVESGNDKINIIKNPIELVRYIVITKPTDIYYVHNLSTKTTNNDVARRIKIYLYPIYIKNASMPTYPNYTIVVYKSGEKFLAETYPNQNDVIKQMEPPDNAVGYVGMLSNNDEYIETKIKIFDKIILPEFSSLHTETNALDKIKHYHYKDNELLYIWSIGYIISELLNDEYGKNKVSVDLVGSFARLLNKYRNRKITNVDIKYLYNDVDIIVCFKDNRSNEIPESQYSKVFEYIDKVIEAYQINGKVKIRKHIDHHPIINREYFETDANNENNITIHIMINTPIVYNDVSKMVKYHRLASKYTYHNNESCMEKIGEYSLNDMLEEPLGIKDMINIVNNEKIRKAFWRKAGLKYIYESLTRETDLKEKAYDNSIYYEIAETTSEKCRLYKYIIKWATINIAYAKDNDSIGIQPKREYIEKKSYSSEFIEDMITKIINQAYNILQKNKRRNINMTLKKQDADVLKNYYRSKNCNQYPDTTNNDELTEIKETITKYLKAIQILIEEK